MGRGVALAPANLRSWLAGVDRDDEALREFARRLDDACREAEKVSGREFPERLAVVVVLRVVADDLAAEAPKTSLAPVDWQPVTRGPGLTR